MIATASTAVPFIIGLIMLFAIHEITSRSQKDN